MSYPSLGCFAKCLTCELCNGLLPPSPGGIDLNVPSDYFDYTQGDSDFDGIPDWADPDWGPDPAPEQDPFDGFPTGIPLGGGVEARPTWNPWGLEIHGRF